MPWEGNPFPDRPRRCSSPGILPGIPVFESSEVRVRVRGRERGRGCSLRRRRRIDPRNPRNLWLGFRLSRPFAGEPVLSSGRSRCRTPPFDTKCPASDGRQDSTQNAALRCSLFLVLYLSLAVPDPSIRASPRCCFAGACSQWQALPGKMPGLLWRSCSVNAGSHRGLPLHQRDPWNLWLRVLG